MIYDLMILGGGPAGYTGAERAGQAGLKTVLFEKSELGGVCLNEGCIPSKTLLNSAKILDAARGGKAFAVSASDLSIDQEKLIKRKNKIVRMLVSGIKTKMKEAAVDVIKANAVILGKEDDLFLIEAAGEKYAGRNILICTGSVPVVPPIPGLQEGLASGFAVTNKGILDLEEIPKQLAVIGGGVIGLEMASYYCSAGSEVFVIEMQDGILAGNEPEISSMLQKAYEKKGIKFYLGTKLTEVKEKQILFEQDGLVSELEADIVLLSVGRKAVLTGFGLENIELEIEKGAIKTDNKCRSNVPGVYAAGDVNGRWMLAHAASREAEVAVNTILGKEDEMRYDNCPSVVYTNPEVVFVGATAKELDEAGIKYRTVEIPFAYSGRYLAETDREPSLCKLLVYEESDTVAGCHMMGSYVSEIIVAAGLMIERKMTVDQIKAQIFPHPTVAEVIREAIFML